MVSPRPRIASIRFGRFALDVRSGELTSSESRVVLQEQPLKILLRLLDDPGALVSRDELREELWPSDTFVDFDHGLNAAVRRLRDALGDSAEAPTFIETLPRRGYRFIGSLQVERSPADGAVPAIRAGSSVSAHTWIRVSTVVGLLLITIGGWRVFSRPSAVPAPLIVVADVYNRTDEPVLTGTLKQALAVKLAESHFISVLSDEQVRETLKTMRRNADEPLTAAVAGEVCQRNDAQIALSGSIAALGSAYVISLDALSCATGATIARDQAQASRKEDILATVDTMAARLRERLGESPPAVRAANTRLERATTTSLEALKAYTEAEARFVAGLQAESVRFYRRAIDLDPDFAMAHAKLGLVYFNLTMPGGVEQLTTAFEGRERLTEHERFYVTAHYYRLATSDPDASRPVYEIWKTSYPRDPVPYNSLGLLDVRQGRFDRALAEFEGAVHTAVPTGVNVSNLLDMYLHVGRTADAMRLLERWEHDIGRGIRYGRFLVAVQQRNIPAVEVHGAALRDESDGIENADAERARAAALFGRMGRARALFDSAATAERQADRRLNAALLKVEEAVWEAEIGECAHARTQVINRAVTEAASMNQGQLVRGLSAIVLATCGDAGTAEQMVARVERPALLGATARARIDLARGRLLPALDTLTRPATVDLSGPLGYAYAGQSHGLAGIYLRGQTYLRLGQGRQAAVEFQKILDQPGIAMFAPYHALAPLYLARAHSVAGDLTRSRAAYEQFLRLWSGADADLPVVREARREFTRFDAH